MVKTKRTTPLILTIAIVAVLGILYLTISPPETGWIKNVNLTSQYNHAADIVINGSLIQCLYPECSWNIYLNDDHPNIMRIYACDGLYEDKNFSVTSPTDGVLIEDGWALNTILTDLYKTLSPVQPGGPNYFVFSNGDLVRVYSGTSVSIAPELHAKYAYLMLEGAYLGNNFVFCGD